MKFNSSDACHDLFYALKKQDMFLKAKLQAGFESFFSKRYATIVQIGVKPVRTYLVSTFMKIDDPQIQTHQVDGQLLYVPTSLGWQMLLMDMEFDGHKLPVPKLLASKVNRNEKYPEILSALGFAWGRVHFYELLCVEGILYRVFIEAVICDNCGHQAIASATPGVSEIYYGSVDEDAAIKRSYGLPNQRCHMCNQPFQRRQTVWQVNDAVANRSFDTDTQACRSTLRQAAKKLPRDIT